MGTNLDTARQMTPWSSAFPVEAGTRLVGVAFQERNWAPEGVGAVAAAGGEFRLLGGGGLGPELRPDRDDSGLRRDRRPV